MHIRVHFYKSIFTLVESLPVSPAVQLEDNYRCKFRSIEKDTKEAIEVFQTEELMKVLQYVNEKSGFYQKHFKRMASSPKILKVSMILGISQQ